MEAMAALGIVAAENEDLQTIEIPPGNAALADESEEEKKEQNEFSENDEEDANEGPEGDIDVFSEKGETLFLKSQ